MTVQDGRRRWCHHSNASSSFLARYKNDLATVPRLNRQPQDSAGLALPSVLRLLTNAYEDLTIRSCRADPWLKRRANYRQKIRIKYRKIKKIGNGFVISWLAVVINQSREDNEERPVDFGSTPRFLNSSSMRNILDGHHHFTIVNSLTYLDCIYIYTSLQFISQHLGALFFKTGYTKTSAVGGRKTITIERGKKWRRPQTVVSN